MTASRSAIGQSSPLRAPRPAPCRLRNRAPLITVPCAIRERRLNRALELASETFASRELDKKEENTMKITHPVQSDGDFAEAPP